jgi:DNA-binding transcriptional MerR regulator
MGEVVAYSGLSRQTVHNYTSMGLLREAERTGGGHRLYEESVFQRLDEVAEMRSRGMSIQKIREHFVPKGEAGM